MEKRDKQSIELNLKNGKTEKMENAYKSNIQSFVTLVVTD